MAAVLFVFGAFIAPAQAADFELVDTGNPGPRGAIYIKGAIDLHDD
jgi:hypothetical protein